MIHLNLALFLFAPLAERLYTIVAVDVQTVQIWKNYTSQLHKPAIMKRNIDVKYGEWWWTTSATADISLNNTASDDNKAKERNNYNRFSNHIQIQQQTSTVRWHWRNSRCILLSTHIKQLLFLVFAYFESIWVPWPYLIRPMWMVWTCFILQSDW